MKQRERVAVFGGDGRRPRRLDIDGEITRFAAPKYGGNGSLRRLGAGLRAGGFDRLVILVRWCDHSSSEGLVRLCRQLDIPWEMRP